jgi:cytochrome c553
MQISMKKILMLLGTILLLAVLLAACGGKPEPTVAPTQAPVEETPVVLEVPYQTQWENSAHNAVDTEAFRHWDAEDPAEVPAACAKCHSTAGYQDFLGADGSEVHKVDAAVPAGDAQGIQCIACHNPVATNLNRVAFPGFETDEAGNAVPYVVEGFGDASRCLVCHQGRESKASVDAQIARFQVSDDDAVVAPIKDDKGNDVRFGFRNIHYYAAAATLYGTEVKGGYEYEGKTYDAKFRHVEGFDTCIGCHDPHTLESK